MLDHLTFSSDRNYGHEPDPETLNKLLDIVTETFLTLQPSFSSIDRLESEKIKGILFLNVQNIFSDVFKKIPNISLDDQMSIATELGMVLGVLYKSCDSLFDTDINITCSFSVILENLEAHKSSVEKGFTSDNVMHQISLFSQRDETPIWANVEIGFTRIYAMDQKYLEEIPSEIIILLIFELNKQSNLNPAITPETLLKLAGRFGAPNDLKKIVAIADGLVQSGELIRTYVNGNPAYALNNSQWN